MPRTMGNVVLPKMTLSTHIEMTHLCYSAVTFKALGGKKTSLGSWYPWEHGCDCWFIIDYDLPLHMNKHTYTHIPKDRKSVV